MIRSILIANRGEIALRIIRACRDLGIRSVAVYSNADVDSLHVKMADEAVCIGGPTPADSYLNGSNIITAACLTRCDAIHPGVGFLSENSRFAKATENSGLIFIGPDSETIALMGDKIEAKRIAKAIGVPTTIGSEGPLADMQTALSYAEAVGYPVILKAAAGGGGRGMRIIENRSQMPEMFAAATKEALSYFADGNLLLEKFIGNARHVEVQLLADSFGNVIHLGERDCSVQHHHQKLIEESPCAALDEKTKVRMTDAAIEIFKHIGYRGAGTVEFLLYNDEFYFMEVNTRLQVEHPVSEMVCGIDIVQQQIHIADKEALPFSQEEVTLTGHALECRINALSPGKIENYIPCGGPWVRIDSHIYSHYSIGCHYDHLLAKIIVHTSHRNHSIRVMKRALQELVIEGIVTNRDQQLQVLDTMQFKTGQFSTNLFDQVMSVQKSQTRKKAYA
ncbi:MAG: acetyl-CoA carboxylase biotin carboxylase subunit [Sphaerochaetaceae bacterium]|nr:acetyl-CoA carboxylase biotin carboxylase subunit [Sphaerochaetaceae bacterium]NLO60594.1 acetyl-CoA carboxylase biotin carboxylase subunit [Spirochaetales bacterium]MDD2405997.1 acetyl-CoA carboxylase biotin carboxylase subunit [Sphaerochaetaceae bacterium]MDD3670008.1 acetyl-CoA carboxylase biotin carboxylase subunit [Sphaerochaetaceae bacterium]MDD4259829.1 acetyl-CoA carboxylase biotin carboxylase subunit [Sphaerochaetaceae bacterium]